MSSAGVPGQRLGVLYKCCKDAVPLADVEMRAAALQRGGAQRRGVHGGMVPAAGRGAQEEAHAGGRPGGGEGGRGGQRRVGSRVCRGFVAAGRGARRRGASASGEAEAAVGSMGLAAAFAGVLGSCWFLDAEHGGGCVGEQPGGAAACATGSMDLAAGFAGAWCDSAGKRSRGEFAPQPARAQTQGKTE